MPGQYSPKNLANGVAATLKTTVYTVPSGRGAILRSISLVNVVSSAVAVHLTANFGSGSRYFAPKPMTILPGEAVEHDVGLTLEAGDVIEIWADTASAVDYIVSGVEEV